jgi:segregation and condensation protein A
VQGDVRFWVEVAGFSGGLDELLARAQRGDVDLAAISVAGITGGYRRRLAAAEVPPDPGEVADFLTLAARLVALKATRLLPTGAIEAESDGGDDAPVDDPGARLAEYRLFRAAADALLAEAAEQGVRSFLGLVSAEVVPTERLSIPPERLAAAFRRVLERIPEPEPITLDAVTFSVPDKVGALRALLGERRRLGFEELFEKVRSRLEAVAVFLALLELIKAGEARVDQESAFGEISVAAVARAVAATRPPP